MEPETILVTGAAGFIGRHVLAELRARGHHCLGLTRTLCDLTDAKAVAAFLRGKPIATVVHAAARMPGLGPHGLEDMLRQNVLGTSNLLEALPGKTYFVHISTIDVYGFPALLPIAERSSTEPVTPYAITKLAAEKLVQALCSPPRSCCILRLSHVYGPGDDVVKLIPKTVECVSRNQAPEIYGDGSDLRDFVHVRDVARAVARTVECRATGILNVAS